ncbi:SCO family protein [Deinococcus humi]|uniref:Protein SCO1/2 n=1 Tax=Deinococcus humi TaxID=662880 RepID=A0A7W8JWL2_9DEIO|nr:SCO family protein [Deinococcus humi]MBB5364474.1 protein SCO1/2 [Deinococcus humi]GGO32985.1 SCO family protein [Deinococcus humi]
MTQFSEPVGPSAPSRSWKQSLTLAVLVLCGLLGGVLAYSKLRNPANFFGTSYPPQLAAPPLSGIGEDGQALALSDFRGQTVAVFFGFLNCPNICPTTLAALERVRQALPVRQREQFATLLVSVDPKRDTVAKVREYVRFFSPSAHGMVIPQPQLTQAAASWGVGYQYTEVKGPLDYQVNHTTGIYLVDQFGMRRVVWDYTQLNELDRMVSDIRKVMR